MNGRTLNEELLGGREADPGGSRPGRGNNIGKGSEVGIGRVI